MRSRMTSQIPQLSSFTWFKGSSEQAQSKPKAEMLGHKTEDVKENKRNVSPKNSTNQDPWRWMPLCRTTCKCTWSCRQWGLHGLPLPPEAEFQGSSYPSHLCDADNPNKPITDLKWPWAESFLWSVGTLPRVNRYLIAYPVSDVAVASRWTWPVLTVGSGWCLFSIAM